MDSPLDKGGADRRGDLIIFNAYLLIFFSLLTPAFSFHPYPELTLAYTQWICAKRLGMK
jgi:hypothetical protein